MSRYELELHLKPMKDDIGEIKDLLKEAVGRFDGIGTHLDLRVQTLEQKIAVIDALMVYKKWIVGIVLGGAFTVFAAILGGLAAAGFFLFH